MGGEREGSAASLQMGYQGHGHSCEVELDRLGDVDELLQLLVISRAYKSQSVSLHHLNKIPHLSTAASHIFPVGYHNEIRLCSQDCESQWLQ